jgi:hypothetical protein
MLRRRVGSDSAREHGHMSGQAATINSSFRLLGRYKSDSQIL